MRPADPPGLPPADLWVAGAASSGRGGSLASNLSELTNDATRGAAHPVHVAHANTLGVSGAGAVMNTK